MPKCSTLSEISNFPANPRSSLTYNSANLTINQPISQTLNQYVNNLSDQPNQMPYNQDVKQHCNQPTESECIQLSDPTLYPSTNQPSNQDKNQSNQSMDELHYSDRLTSNEMIAKTNITFEQFYVAVVKQSCESSIDI